MHAVGAGNTLQPVDLRTRLAETELPDEVAQTLSARLENSNASAGSVARAIALPWACADGQPPALAAVQHALDSDHFAPPPAAAAVVEHIAAHHARTAATASSGAPLSLLCLSGPKGVGKTAAARSIARALGRPLEVIDLAQLNSAAEIWRREGQPGALMSAVERAQSAEAVVVLAGLGRAAERWGDKLSALLALLTDARRRASVSDPFFGVPFDLSRLLVIVTCRWTQALAPSDLLALDVAEIPGYLSAQKVELARRTLIPQALADHGLAADALTFDHNTLRVLVQTYTDEAGVARLDALLRQVIRKTLVAHALGDDSAPAVIQTEHLYDLAGRPPAPVRRERTAQRRGRTAALVVDDQGGRHGLVSAVLMPGPGRVTMIDAADTDISNRLATVVAVVRSRLSDLGVSARFMQEFEMHVHVPTNTLAGDMASAGLAVAIAIVSLARDRQVDPELAATGSLSIEGRIESTSGIAPKMLAAHRAGVRRVLLPRGNERDLDDLPTQIHDDITFIPVDDIAQALQVALR